MQSPQNAIDSVLTTLQRREPALGQRATFALSCLQACRDASGQYTSTRYLGGTTVAARAACADSLAALATTVSSRRAQWSGSSTVEDLDWLDQYLLLVRQWQRMAASANGGVERDRAMAENLLWVVDKNPSARVFAWAHNYHVSRKPGAMGAFVAARLNAEYRVFGFTFGTGRFNAVGPTPSDPTQRLTAHTISDVDPLSLESIFAATSQPRLLFDARRIASNGATAVLQAPLRMRSVGALYSAASSSVYFDQTLIPLDYDALIWFSSTTPSVLLPFVR